MPPSAPLDPLTGVSAARFGVYLHFPYCLSKCPYCDFASTAAKQVPEERYARAVQRELELRIQRAPSLARRGAQSVYLGGGTPSLWDPRFVAQVLEAIDRAVGIDSRAEVTLEANPGASDASRFSGYRKAGVNRLSIGVQSFQAQTLAALGRAHDGPMAVAAFRAAREAGFESVSLDFLYGVHGQSLEQVEDDARRAVALGPEHLSAYALTLDRESLAEEVPLAKQLARGELSLPPDDLVVQMGRALREIYGAAGLHRYETSNYAREGHTSRHNAIYWTGGDYLALGAGATGFLASEGRDVPGVEGARVAVSGERYSNARSAEVYLSKVEKGELPTASTEHLGPEELFHERLAMGLRLSTGVDVEAVCRAYGQPWAPREREIAALVEHGLAVRHGERVALTEEGADLHSAISARLF